MQGKVRRSPFAGTWYPKESGELAQLVDGFLEQAGDGGHSSVGVPIGLVSPHAGLVYSGPVAAAGYRRIRDTKADFDSVILLGPSHRVFFDGLAVYPDGAFETPLGEACVDTELATAVLECGPKLRAAAEVHASEHSLEMQLPFLLRIRKDVRIVPILMGNQSEEMMALACEALVRAVSESKRRVLLVASSDLSHYESRERARELDGVVLRCLEAFDSTSLSQQLSGNHQHACGGGPIVSVMNAARLLGATESRVLRYGDSGDASGDVSAVVGYVSAVLTREPSL